MPNVFPVFVLVRATRVSAGCVVRKRHSRAGACEKIEIADFGETPQRHSREGGNPFQPLELDLSVGPRLRGERRCGSLSRKLPPAN
jgi:hypothetical protein